MAPLRPARLPRPFLTQAPTEPETESQWVSLAGVEGQLTTEVSTDNMNTLFTTLVYALSVAAITHTW